jgi:hypothetical protein
MKCPNCTSSEVDLLASVVDEEHCSHDFECFACGCSFTAEYQIHNIHITDEEEDIDGP